VCAHLCVCCVGMHMHTCKMYSVEQTVSSAVLLQTTHYAKILLEDWNKILSQEHHEKILDKAWFTLIRNMKSQKIIYIGILKIPV
jgi:hypothetical protein